MTRFLCDSNVWVALVVDHHAHRQACQDWFDGLGGSDDVFFIRSTQQSFLRLLTTAAVFGRYGSPPLSNGDAWRTYDALLAHPLVAFYEQDPGALSDRWRSFTDRPSASPKLWMDAYLAAFAASAGLAFVTTDHGFRQFSGLGVVVLGEPQSP